MKKLAIFTSGQSRGSNFQSIYNHIKNNKLDIKIDFVFVTDKTAPIVKKTKDLGIDVVYYNSEVNLNDFLAETCLKKPVDLIVLAGFMRRLNLSFFEKVKVPIINIHPALLPKYGGKGMYGMNVHKAVFQAGERVSGATVHYVNEYYDGGEVLFKKECDISFCRNAEEIAEAVLKIEHEIYPKVIKELLSNNLNVKKKLLYRVYIRPYRLSRMKWNNLNSIVKYRARDYTLRSK